MPSGEANTWDIVKKILLAGTLLPHIAYPGVKLTKMSTGKTLYIPKIDVSTPGRMDLLKIYGESDLADLPRGLWGIKEPAYELPDGRRRDNSTSHFHSLQTER